MLHVVGVESCALSFCHSLDAENQSEKKTSLKNLKGETGQDTHINSFIS